MKTGNLVFCILLLTGLRAPATMEAAANAKKPSALVSVKPRLGDRYFITSVLKNVFGPGSKPYVQKFITLNGQVFGGPCDEYEQVRIGPAVNDLADIESACPGGKSGSRLTQIPDESVIRLGYLYRTCDALTNNKATLNYAAKKIGKLSLTPKPQDYFNIVMQFNPTAGITAKDSEVFEKIGQQEAYQKLSSEKKWQLLFGIICKSTDWQVL